MLLKDKVALVTAAAGAGIGQGIVRRFAEEGARVVITDLNGSRAEKLAEALKQEGGHEVWALAADVRDGARIRSVVGDVIAAWGRIDILVNSAGINQIASVWEMNDEAWQSVIDVNLNGTFRATRAVLPHMIEQRAGAVISIASINGWRGSDEGESAYCASKAAVMAFTRAVAAEVGRFGVRINAIAPGLIYNEYLGKIYPQELFDRLAESTPLGRAGEPRDVGDAAVFLASEMSRFVTGEVLCVSGGAYMPA